MADRHTVRFEPVGIEIEACEDETVLDAAFRQGVSLMHGCREGQCSACKAFVLDGDVQMSRYSTFALADYESDEGYVLMCRSHAYSDLEIELENYDEDMIRSGLPVVTVQSRICEISDLSPDISYVRLALDDPSGFRFHPGQYLDIAVPGTDVHRSFSMACATQSGGVLEFIIKRYPGGLFSEKLSTELKVGDPLTLTGPYGTFTLRVSSDRRLVFVAGGAGMSALLALLRQMADSGSDREVVYYYGARTERDLIMTCEIAALAERLPNFTFVPCLSESWPDDWPASGGATGFVTQVLEDREPRLRDCDVYLCGPPPMIDAALPLLESLGVPGHQVFYDKFTITAASED
jgi:propane monooxygenase reductase component